MGWPVEPIIKKLWQLTASELWTSSLTLLWWLSLPPQVNIMFQGNQTNSLMPLEGIAPPVGNTTEENQASICAIDSYLTQLPPIIRDLTNHHQNLIKNIEVFHHQFKGAYEPKKCHINVTTSDDYKNKVLGLQIIHFTRQWVERSSNSSCHRS